MELPTVVWHLFFAFVGFWFGFFVSRKYTIDFKIGMKETSNKLSREEQR